MGSSLPWKSSCYGDECKSLCNSVCKESCADHENSANGTTLSCFGSLKISEKDDLTVQKLENALSNILHLSDSGKCMYNSNSTSSHDETTDETAMEVASLVTYALQEFRDNEVYQSAEDGEYSPPSKSREGLPSPSEHDGSFREPAIKLASAMKGSRAREGLALNLKLSVKWAPDVYDPPPTSESHTVKGYRCHSKLVRKDYHKQKHSRSSSSRGSSGDKKQASRRSSSRSSSSGSRSIDPRISRFKALNEQVFTNSPSHSKVEAADYASMAQELKCGGSIFIESLAPCSYAPIPS